MNYTECLICHCNPKPDEWSGQVEGVCFDCGQKEDNMIDYNLVLYIGLGLIIGGFCFLLYLIIKDVWFD